ncbi:hypothetical protein QQY66_15430 [Streptomyces sp. DG2A-72]|uniref:hypothetical protein n=1 Tax=Streptomyces sp. DG2A-72 TaxID=3051386 RepID=UPI00265BDD86|nr:hypothetical protein [Streptomyces sp. DG2A-72]MDO0933014.1 hypothetical protein [Streptomyces sp. DG2A-72]
MARPADWSALGLGSDPTPGDAARIEEIITSQGELVTLADTIDSGLTEIKNTTDGAFIGETADALRKVIDGDLRNYVSTFRQAHQDAQAALRTYVGVMRTQQQRADAALTAAAALAEDDDEGRETHKSTAEDAGSILSEAAETAATALTTAAESIASPIDECEEFWKALGWLALILIIPAIIVGGPLALFAIGLNVALLIKTAVDFSQGKASVTELVLSILGVIAPTTKGINVGAVFKGLKGAGVSAFQGGRNLFLGGPNAFGLLGRLTLGIDDTFRATGVWLNGLRGISGMRFTPGLVFMPGLKGFTMGGAGLGKGFGVLPVATELTVINLLGVKSFFAVRSVVSGLNGIGRLGSSLGSSMLNGVRGLNGLRFFLPVAADEMGNGLLFALRIGVIDRGVFGMYRYGAFAGGQFLGVSSKISGAAASGLTLLRPGADLGGLSHINLTGFTPTPAGGLGSGLTNLPPVNLSPSIGSTNLTGGLSGLGGSFNAPVPAIGARITDLPAVSGPSGVHMPPLGGLGGVNVPQSVGLGNMNLPQLGQISQVGAVGTGAFRGADIAVGDIAAVGAARIDVPSLSSVASGPTAVRVDMPSVDARVTDIPSAHGVGSVSTPSVGQVDVPAVAQVNVPTMGLGQVNAPTVNMGAAPDVPAVGVHQVNVPSLGAVSNGPTTARVDAPAMAARMTDIPSVNGVGSTLGRVDVPSVGSVNVPSVGRVDVPSVASVNVNLSPVGRVDVPVAGGVSVSPVGRVDVSVAGGVSVSPVGRVDVSVAGGVSVSPVGRVDVSVAGGVSVSPVGRVDVPVAGGVSVSPVGRVDVPATGSVNVPSVGRVEVPAAGSVNVPSVGRVDLPVTGNAGGPKGVVSDVPAGAAHVDAPPVSALGRVDVPVSGTPAVNPAPVNALTAPPTPGTVQHTPTGGLDSSPASHVPPPGTGGPAKNGGVGLPGNDSLVVDLPKLGRVDLTAFRDQHRTIRVFMQDDQALDFQHTFTNIPGLPDVRVEVTPTATGPRVVPATAGVRATYETPQGGGGQFLRVEQDLGDGSVRRTDYHLNAALNHEQIGTQVVRGIELQTLTPQAPPPHTTVAGPSGTNSTPAHAVNVPGLDGVRVDITPGSRPNIVNPNGVQGLRAERIGQDNIVRVEYVNGGETRHWDFDVDAHGTRLVGAERQITLQGGHFGGTTVGIDVLPGGTNGIRHLDVAGAPRPGGITHVGGEYRVPGPGNRTVVYGADYRHVYDELPLTRGALGDGVLRIDADGTVGVTGRPGVNVRVLPGNGGFHVGEANGSWLRVYGADGGYVHRVLPVPGGNLVRFPEGTRTTHDLLDAGGNPVPGARVETQPVGFRIENGGGQPHIVVNEAGVQTHTARRLDGGAADGEFVHRPVEGRPGGIVRTDVAGAPRPGGITHVGGEYRVPGPGNRTVVYGADYRHVYDELPLTRGALGDGVLRIDADGTVGVTGRPGVNVRVLPGNGGFHVGEANGSWLRVYGVDGGYVHRVLPVPGGNLVRFPEGTRATHDLLDAGGNPVPGARVETQPVGFRIENGGGQPHIVVNEAGVQTHTARRLDGGAADGEFVHRPVEGRPGGIVRTDVAGAPRPGGITHVGGEYRVPGPGNRTVVYGADYRHVYDELPLTRGALNGGVLRIDPVGTARLHGHPTATVVPQSGDGNGFRVLRGNDHVAVDIRGNHTAAVRELTGGTAPHANGEFVHTPVNGPAVLKHADGSAIPNSHLTVRADGSFLVEHPTALRVHRAADGRVDIDTVRLQNAAGAPIGQNVRAHPGGALELVDNNLAEIPNIKVTARPGGGHRVEQADGGFQLYGNDGRLDRSVIDTGQGGVFRVDDGNGTRLYDTVRLGDGIGTRFLRTDLNQLRVLDADLTPTPGNVTREPNGQYRVDGVGAPHQGEFKRYDADGRLDFQRINVIHEGQIKPNQHIEVTYPNPAAGGAKPTWQRIHLDAAGNPVPPNGNRPWYDGGTVDLKGIDHGRVRLLGHSGTEVFERRPLPFGNGGSIDAFHSAAGVGTFGRFNQRGVWTEFDGAGAAVRHGTRHWGESGRSYFDVTTIRGVDTRVRHFQQNPDGGHVLANLDRSVWTQSAGRGTWHRFDADYNHLAEGARKWGPGRGWTDTMAHPRTGASTVVHEKFGRFAPSPHDVRRYFQVEMGADGIPKRDWMSHSPHGKEIDRGETLSNGNFLETHRIAEQRPPFFARWAMSGDYRATSLADASWLRFDGRYQIHEWKLTPAAGGLPERGVRFVSMSGVTTDIARNGQVVRVTGKTPSGNDLTVGDVPLPNGVNRQANYLPWSEGAGKLDGHRTYVAADFHVPQGYQRGDILFQDRFTPNRADGDWYSPDPNKQWEVARTGFKDGTVIEYRPAPAVRPDGQAGNGDIAFQQNVHAGTGDWTKYDPHGMVVGRKDTWPDPAGGGNNTITITATGPAGAKTLEWHGPNGTHGIRQTQHQRGMETWAWDKESFQDFDGGRLIREHRLLGDGTTVDAWRVSRDPNTGAETWQWNKIDRHGNVMDFGGGAPHRVRNWIDSNGNVLPGWRPDARWQDQVATPDPNNPATINTMTVQEIPARPATGPIHSWATDAPFRVREYVPDVGGTFNSNVWKEFDNGIDIRRKTDLGDGTFLESEEWHKQWRRYGGPNGTTLLEQRAISGYIWNTDTFGRTTLIGRETNFIGALGEYRGFSRMWREPNRWDFGRSVGGEAVYTPFAGKAAQMLAVEMGQEWLLDFSMNLVVYGIVAAATGSEFGWNDVAKAAFGATVSAGVKGTLSAGHLATFRGGPWKTGLGQMDMGQPYSRRPNDDSWQSEFAGNEKVTRWRSGSYDFGLSIVGGALSGFIGGSASAAIFGVKDKDGNTVHLYGTDALLVGAAGAAAGVIGGVTTGLARTIITQNIAGRWYHRQGFFDIFVVAGMGKLANKIFANMYLTGAIRDSVVGDVGNSGGGA